MKRYCMKCGVAVEHEKNKTCPLCGLPILTDEELSSIDFLEISDTKKKIKKVKDKSKDREIERNKKGVFAYIAFLVTIITIGLMFLLDALIVKGLSFSLVVNSSMILMFMLVAVPFRWKKTLRWYIIFDAIMLITYFFFLDWVLNSDLHFSIIVNASIMLSVLIVEMVFYLIGHYIFRICACLLGCALYVLMLSVTLASVDIFAKIALPICIVVFIVSIFSYLFIYTYHYNVFSIFKVINISVLVIVISVNIIVNKYIGVLEKITWSKPVIFSLVPLFILLNYLNKHKSIHRFLRKYFHV